MGTRVVVIGAGIVGLAVADRLMRSARDIQVLVIDKEKQVARHQSGHNSGVLHAGTYYKPGSAKAVLSRQGITAMKAFCSEHGIAWELCGKLIVATTPAEEQRLVGLKERAEANGLSGVRIVGREEMLEREPHVGGRAALLVPEEGIVDYPAVCTTLARLIEQRGGEVRLETQLLGAIRTNGKWLLRTSAAEVEAHFIINCAGLQSDRVARLCGESPRLKIVPFRGEYYRLKKEREFLVKHLIYPVPDPAFPFLGVHFTRRVRGGIEAGPNAVVALAREGYRWTNVNLRDAAELLAFGGFLRFVLRHRRAALAEVSRSLSRRRFAASLQQLVPDVRAEDLEECDDHGVRAMAMMPDGSLVDDFLFADGPSALHVLNAPSPAATASLAIAEAIIDRAMANGLGT